MCSFQINYEKIYDVARDDSVYEASITEKTA